MAFCLPSSEFRVRGEKGQFQVEPRNKCINAQQLLLCCVMTPMSAIWLKGLLTHSIIAAP